MDTAIDSQPPKNLKRAPNQPGADSKPTPVILVCINNVSGQDISHDLLHTIFSPFGKVLKILIFEKLKIWKIFVEFSTVEAALNARHNLNNVPLFDDGTKIAIYPSALETVKFQHNNVGGRGYTADDNAGSFSGLGNPSRMTQDSLNITQSFDANPHLQSSLQENNGWGGSNVQVLGSHNQAELEFDTRRSDSGIEPPLTDSPPSESLPPGLGFPRFEFPSQPKPQSLQGGPSRLVRSTQSMNFIPMSNTLGQKANLMGEPRRQEGPPKLTNFGSFNQIPQFGSMNNLPMPVAPNYGGGASNTTAHQSVNFSPMNQQQQIQQRPQLTKFFSQNDIPLLTDFNMLTQGLHPGSNDNARGLNQPGPGTFGYETLNQLHDNLSMLLGKGEENKKSRVLYVKGLEHKDIKVQMLYNIFSNFGNILKIIFIPSKQSALLEFENVEYSTICIDQMNNIVFMGKPLRIYYSKYSVINVKNKKEEEAAEEVFVGTPQSFRFKKNKPLSINPPSSILHLSNLLKEICTEDKLRQHFAPYGHVEALKFILMENNKNMCLLKMSSMEESLNAMAHLHDTDLGGRKVQISFTRSKI